MNVNRQRIIACLTLIFTVHAASKSAKQAIEKAGGTVQLFN
jgi:ribosomal protein L15